MLDVWRAHGAAALQIDIPSFVPPLLSPPSLSLQLSFFHVFRLRPASLWPVLIDDFLQLLTNLLWPLNPDALYTITINETPQSMR